MSRQKPIYTPEELMKQMERGELLGAGGGSLLGNPVWKKSPPVPGETSRQKADREDRERELNDDYWRTHEANGHVKIPEID